MASFVLKISQCEVRLSLTPKSPEGFSSMPGRTTVEVYLARLTSMSHAFSCLGARDLYSHLIGVCVGGHKREGEKKAIMAFSKPHPKYFLRKWLFLIMHLHVGSIRQNEHRK